MTIYEELTPEMREQVDAFLHNARSGPMYAINDFQEDYLREAVSNLVMTCVFIAKEKPKPSVPINKRRGRYY